MSRQIDRLEGLKVNHSHSFNVTYSRSYLVQVTIVELFLFSLVHNAWQLKRGWRLKYRYVLMSGNADAKTLDRLENCFEWNRVGRKRKWQKCCVLKDNSREWGNNIQERKRSKIYRTS